MSDVIRGVIDKSTAQEICDAVKEKEGSTEGVPFNTVADRIRALSVGGGENKFNQIIERTVTEITAEDLKDVSRIGAFAFYDCKKLKKVTIPTNITSIGIFAFTNAGFIDDVYIDDLAHWCELDIGNISDTSKYDGTNPIQYASKFYLKNALGEYEIPTSLEIPNTVRRITKTAFAYAQNIQSVTIGGNVKEILPFAFNYCNALETLTIENGVETIGSNAFGSCTTLGMGGNPIIIPDSVRSVGANAFANCKVLTSVIIHDGVTSIGKYAFQNCAKIAEITIPDSVQSIGDNVFDSCRNLKSVTIGNGVTDLGNYLLSSCYEVTNFTIASPIKKSLSLSNPSKLTIDSLKSIINALVDYSGTENEGKYKLTLNSACLTRLDAEGATAPDGLTWKEYVSAKGWLLG